MRKSLLKLVHEKNLPRNSIAWPSYILPLPAGNITGAGYRQHRP